MSKAVVYYFIEDGQDGSASLQLFKTKEARDRAAELSEEQNGRGLLDEGFITQDEIDNAKTLDEVEAEAEDY